MRVIESTYRDSKKDQFQLEVLGEFSKHYVVRLLPKWQNQFQEGKGIHTLRKCLVGSDTLYKFVSKDKGFEQLTLF